MEFQIQIPRQGIACAREIHLHTVIHHEVHGNQRLNHFRVLAKTIHRRAHGCQINQQRHAGEVLQNDPRDDEGNFIIPRGLGIPVGEVFHVLFSHLLAIAIPHQRFQDDADGNGQARNFADPGFFKGGQ